MSHNVINEPEAIKTLPGIDSGMTEKNSNSQDWPKPWFWGLPAYKDTVPDGPYAQKMDAVSGYLQNGTGIPPADARMDFCGCNLALSLKKVKT